MCYSKEVQLITGLIIIIASLFFYFYYSRKYDKLRNKPWLQPLLKYGIAFALLIGAHQLFEFLALVTENVWIYKIGLTSSIFGMYFIIRSFEVFANKNIHSKVVLGLVALASLHVIISPVEFTSRSFYVRQSSIFVWTAIWTFVYMYFNICALRFRATLKDASSRTMVTKFLLYTAGLSFLLSGVYIIFGFYNFGVNVCQDTPSIWCTFAVIQVLLLPFFLSYLPKRYNRPKKQTTQSMKDTIINFSIALAIVIFLTAITPYFNCFSWKWIFP